MSDKVFEILCAIFIGMLILAVSGFLFIMIYFIIVDPAHIGM